MGLSWFLAPMFDGVASDATAPDGEELPTVRCAGSDQGEGLAPFAPPGRHARFLCYREAEGDVLVGTHTELAPAPPDWTPLSLGQAKAHFQAVTGQPPHKAWVY